MKKLRKEFILEQQTTAKKQKADEQTERTKMEIEKVICLMAMFLFFPEKNILFFDLWKQIL